MRVRRARSSLILVLVTAAFGVSTSAVQGQEEVYLQAVAEHYRVSSDEIRVLHGWGRPAGELPVVLHVASRAGISPDAVMALRNSGRGWLQIAGRWQLHAGDFHVALDPAQDPGPLARVYEGYRGSPRTGWPALQLEDREVEALVHLRFLTEYLGVPPGRVLTALARAGSGPAALEALRRGP